ncbi:Uu.00g028730.m01.CDS01 [Anthostomella pinea]|uniref:Uu.00g028730.m01.CDS01 n=1 Tax=Anthostomella pinea TaxID=933095 RepID=A0AAI8V8Z9_9PEZI|nr:Uu.00g028730.m01.CDS01 [Anthostomella pinea]
MVADKLHTAALGHCHKATVLGNTIAIHMLEYLDSTTTTSPQDVNQLAHVFLEVCRIMWSIEVGLTQYSRNKQTLPPDMVGEFDKKFQTTHNDFQILDNWLSKSLHQSKGSKISRGWRRMFADNEVGKMTEALVRTKETLRMSALVFQWTVGEAKIKEQVGIGYTALAAALDQMDGAASVASMSKMNLAQPHVKEVHDGQLRPATLRPLVRQISSNTLSPNPFSPTGYPPRNDSYAQSGLSDPAAAESWADLREMIASSRVTTPSNHSVSTRSIITSPPTTAPTDILVDPRTISLAEFSNFSIDDDASALTLDSKPVKAVRLSADPGKMPRWSPRDTHGAEAPALRHSLLTAIQDRNSTMVEQLLDRGVSPEIGPDNHVPLKDAIAQRDPETVRLLLLFGAEPTTPDRDGVTPLFAAVEQSLVDIAATLLKYGADPNFTSSSNHESPFGVAIIKEHPQLIRLLLMYGANGNATLVDGETVLTKTISKTCNKLLVDLILEYGADANKKTNEGKTPLFEAITSGRPDIVTSLLDHKADPNLPGPKHMLWPATYQPPCLKILLARGADHKKTPGIMELATSINKIESVRMLLKAGVNPNAKKDGVYTPLCTSIRDDHADIFQLLLANGADPNVCSAEFPAFKCVTHFRPQYLAPLVAAGANLNSPKGIIETAVAFDNMEALKWLLEQGVSPNDKVPKTNATGLTTAIRENKPEMVGFLLSHGANPNIRGEDWPICMAVQHPTVLQRLLPALSQPRAFKGVVELACRSNQLESVKLLLAAGVSVEDRNGGVFSPLTTAIRERHKDIVHYLVEEAGADPNAPGEHLPLIKALRRYEEGDTEVIELLLAKGADPNKVYRGYNAVFQAIEMGDARILAMLVEKWGVDLTAVDDSDRTPVGVAESRGWDEGIEILQKAKKAVA